MGRIAFFPEPTVSIDHYAPWLPITVAAIVIKLKIK